jgi:predicted  nucleic acid-binding Zn-ribbon protein
MEELKAVSTRNEELLVERDEDTETIRKLEADAADYKRKWETTRTQLRNLKGESLATTHAIGAFSDRLRWPFCSHLHHVRLEADHR